MAEYANLQQFNQPGCPAVMMQQPQQQQVYQQHQPQFVQPMVQQQQQGAAAWNQANRAPNPYTWESDVAVAPRQNCNNAGGYQNLYGQNVNNVASPPSSLFDDFSSESVQGAPRTTPPMSMPNYTAPQAPPMQQKPPVYAAAINCALQPPFPQLQQPVWNQPPPQQHRMHIASGNLVPTGAGAPPAASLPCGYQNLAALPTSTAATGMGAAPCGYQPIEVPRGAQQSAVYLPNAAHEPRHRSGALRVVDALHLRRLRFWKKSGRRNGGAAGQKGNAAASGPGGPGLNVNVSPTVSTNKCTIM